MEKFGIEKKGIDDIEGSSETDSLDGCNGCNGCQEEGSSATDSLSEDVTDVSSMEVGSF
ncbi:hypothetical protein QUA30_03965 [Microcoleus sp. Pol14C2]|uniref:hypothetical protein n=1 Tax=unclassified Microcoleus TaxID=2642155 RepID=UPI002FD6A74B